MTMNTPTVFDTCRPRADVLAGGGESEFAADLSRVAGGGDEGACADAGRFFADSYPTRGLRALLGDVCRRLAGRGDAAVFRLDTAFGGGKTHGLIALVHAARGMAGVGNAAEFLDPALVPARPVRVAAFDGVNADPANGRRMDGEVRARTPWGEIAYALGGRAGFELVRASDESGAAPGAGTLQELFGGEPALVLLDELSIYLRKARRQPGADGQLTAFLSTLFGAVARTPNAAAVYTLALGREGRSADAYGDENRYIADSMAEAESVSARTATLLNPTAEDETAPVLRRRLFESIDDAAAAPAFDAWRALWAANREALPEDAARPEAVAALRACYPFHPEVLEVLTGKTATLGAFQRVRGMLRLLAAAVAQLWEERPADAAAIHVHHIDPGRERVRRGIVTRLEQSAYVPAILNDIAGQGSKQALAQRIDAARHAGLPPYAAYAARTAFMHTLAFNDQLKGVSPERLRYSMLAPGLDIGFIAEARKRFVADSAYLDDRPGVPMRFLAEANLTRIVQHEEAHVDAMEARAELDDRIGEVFSGKIFETVRFPGGPFDVDDEAGSSAPKLVVISYDAVTVGDAAESVPELVERIYSRKGKDGAALRIFRNAVAFAAADETLLRGMRRKAATRLALRALKRPERLADLAEHQQERVRELERRSEQELALSIQQCYRHLFYPSRNRMGASPVDLAHTALDVPAVSNAPGAGQKQVERALRGLGKLRMPGDEPDSPAWVRDRTPLKKKGEMTTRALRDEFRRDPALPMLIGDETFVRGVRAGIESGVYVYRSGELLCGPGDPKAEIRIDEQSLLFTMACARERGVWPRKPAETPPDEERPPPDPRPLRPAPGGELRNGKAPAPPDSVSAEGVLRAALTRLWEQARGANIAAIGALTLKMYEAGDAFRLFGAVGAAPGAAKTVRMAGGYETADGGEFALDFHGPVSDAQPVRDFLQPQLRAAKTQTLQVTFALAFADGLPMAGDAAEKLTARLSQFAGGAAHVTASAAAKAGAPPVPAHPPGAAAR